MTSQIISDDKSAIKEISSTCDLSGRVREEHDKRGGWKDRQGPDLKGLVRHDKDFKWENMGDFSARSA